MQDSRTLTTRRRGIFRGLGDDSFLSAPEVMSDGGGASSSFDAFAYAASARQAGDSQLASGASLDSGGLSDADKALIASLGGAIVKTGGQVASAVLPSVLAKTPLSGFFSGARPAPPPPSIFGGVAPYLVIGGIGWGLYEFFVKPRGRGR